MITIKEYFKEKYEEVKKESLKSTYCKICHGKRYEEKHLEVMGMILNPEVNCKCSFMYFSLKEKYSETIKIYNRVINFIPRMYKDRIAEIKFNPDIIPHAGRKSVIVYGNVGTGKTTYLYFLSVIYPTIFQNETMRVEYRDFILSRELRDKALRIPILLIDDFANYNLDRRFQKEDLHLIIDHRYSHELKTIIATNIPSPKEMSGNTTEQIVDRLFHGADFKKMTEDKSYRRQ